MKKNLVSLSFIQFSSVLRLNKSWILGTLIHSTSNPLSNMPNAHVYDAPPPILKLMLPAKVKLISYGSFAFFYLLGQADQYTRQWLGSICWQLKRPHLAVPNVNSQHWKGWVWSLRYKIKTLLLLPPVPYSRTLK